MTAAPVDAGSYALSESGPVRVCGFGVVVCGWDADGEFRSHWRWVRRATCTIVNDDIPATLTLVKQVVNDDGGTAVATEWTLTATGPTAGVSGPTGDPAVTGVPVSAGSYDLSESGPVGLRGARRGRAWVERRRGVPSHVGVGRERDVHDRQR